MTPPGPPVPSGRPLAGEYADYAQPDIDAVAGDDICETLLAQEAATLALFRQFGEAGGDLSYGPGKWSVRQVLGHLADDERIFAYRALCLSRGDDRELPGFDERQYVAGANFERLPIEVLLEEYRTVRRSSISLFRSLHAEAWIRRGRVNGYAATPRGLAFHIAGHELHHHRILFERYLPLAQALPAGRVRDLTLVVRPDDLSTPEVQSLVAEHLSGMAESSPPGHVYALALESLRAPDVTLWTAWSEGALCGCGALKELDAASGEIKSMRTRAAFARRGVAQAILEEIERTARQRGYARLLLETGTGPAFAAAHALYLRNGFTRCEPFGDYTATEFNIFMVKRLG